MNSNFCRYGRKCKHIAFDSNFVFRPQILIFSVLINGMSFPVLIANYFYVTVLWLFTFAINWWHRKFVTADVTAEFVNDQHGIQRQRQDFDKKFVFEGVHSKERSTDKFPEKRWRKHGVSKLLKTLRDTGTIYTRLNI